MEIKEEALLKLNAADLERIYKGIVDKLPSRAPIFLPTERIPLVDRIIGIDHVRRIYAEDLDRIYRPRLRELRKKYSGRDRCFLIGNGPSLNRTDLNALKDEVTFAVNGFFLKAAELKWTPTFYLVEDHLVAEDRAWWINRFKGPIKLFPAYLGYSFPAAEDTIFYNHRPRKSYPHGFDFSLEADKVTYTGCTVTFSMMQIAAYLGFKEIVLVGVDATYDIPADVAEGKDYNVGVLDMKSDDKNHFHPDYFGKGFRWHDPQVHKMVEAYEEARRTLSGTSQKIINATVGGKLEVFERRDLRALVPTARAPEVVEAENEASKLAHYSKLLIFDMTAIGNGSATGEVKATLFDSWPHDRLLQVARHGKDGLALVRPTSDDKLTSTIVDTDEATKAIQSFSPDVILYRPVPEVPWLHNFAMTTIRTANKPVITWLMDDWPASLAVDDRQQWESLAPDLHELLKGSAANFSICDHMSKAFQQRYNVPFKAFANAINPVHWPGLRHHDQHKLRLRYSGGLAPNMSLGSVLRIARAVETLANEGLDISFEISTQPWWYRDHAAKFADLPHTTVETLVRSPEEYRRWLSDADAVLIAYNFNEETLRYVQYSMANKMPECLASGAALIAHGPREVATIGYLADTGGALILDEPDEIAVSNALRGLLLAPSERNRLTRRAWRVAQERHNVAAIKEELRLAIQEASTIRPFSSLGPAKVELPLALDIRRLVELEEDPHALLVKLSTGLLLAPDSTKELLTRDLKIRDKLDSALKFCNNDDPILTHFQSVVRHVGA